MFVGLMRLSLICGNSLKMNNFMKCLEPVRTDVCVALKMSIFFDAQISLSSISNILFEVIYYLLTADYPLSTGHLLQISSKTL